MTFSENLLKQIASDPDGLRAAVLREQAERSLGAFIRQAWSVIEPGTTYIDNWHIELIAEHLQAVNSGEIRRLIINIPPRHMKSIEATVCYPVWTWIQHPEKRFIKVSYSDALSRKHNILSRDIINSPWYQENWSDRFHLKYDVNRQNEFENNHHGMLYSTSVGGAITGNGADVIIIDDPQNPIMANSETERQNSIDFFKNTLQTRLNNPKTGAFIIIMQRLHENDLTGYILSEDLGYTHLCLPAEAPERTVITFPVSKRQIVREAGDILNPQRFDHEVIESLKKSMGSLQYAGQFQQVPAPAEGVIFKREWLHNFYSDGAAPNTQDIQSWDMAFTKSEGSAKVAGFVMGRKGADIYIKDLVNDKMTFTESVAAVRTLYRDAFGALGKADEERVARAAAERGGHIEILRVGEDDKAEQHHRHAREQRGAGLHQIEVIEEIHGLADDDRIDEHSDADRLAQKDVDDEDGEGDRDGSRAVEDAERFGGAEIQHLPRADADVRLNGEIDAETVEKERDRREEHIQQNRAGRGIVPQRGL